MPEHKREKTSGRVQMLKYLQAAQYIMEQIQKENMKPLSKLPTENELIKTLNMSRKSIRSGMHYLESRGIIHTIQGSGSYVSGQMPDEAPSHNIAMVTVSMDKYIFPDKINGLYDVFSSSSYFLSLFATQNSIESENKILTDILNGNFAGIILEATMSTLPRVNTEIFRKLQAKMPIIMMDSTYKELNLPSVAMNDIAGGELAVNHLIENGHRNILYFGRIDSQQGLDRFSGYLCALNRHTIPFQEDRMFWSLERDHYPDYFEYHQDSLMKQLKTCTAAFCCNDMTAAWLIAFLNQKGFSVPDDFSVVGYDDSLIASGDLNLTSVIHPKRALGERTARAMLKVLADKSCNPNYLFEPKLHVRGSVKRI